MTGRLGIVGAGPAGIAAAIWAYRLGIEAFILERTQDLGGQLTQYSLPIVDLPGFAPAPSARLVERFRDDLARLHVPVYYGAGAVGWADGSIVCRDGRAFAADHVIYAPGLRVRRLGIPGEEWAFGGSAGDLANSALHQQILVVGSGDRGIEAALRLADKGHAVVVASRSSVPSARAPYRRALAQSGVAVLPNAEVKAITRNGARVSAELSGKMPYWTGDAILIRVGMEPDLAIELAAMRHDLAYSRYPDISVVGDAALEPWERSLVTAHASAMQAVKRYVLGLS
jgi:thioredoxin reductase (NADPH)